MPVTEVNLTSIDARRFSKPGEQPGQVRVDHNSTVTLVQQRNAGTADVEFRYTASYGNMGIIRIEGALAFQGEASALEEEWSDSNQMPTEVASEIHTAVMRSCVPEAVGIAKNLNLPPPIPLPQVQFQEEQQGGQGGGGGHRGPEVA